MPIARNVPYYVQIAQALREELLAGNYSPYSEFPDEAALAARFGVSKDVIRQSRGMLRDEGLLKTVKGKGTYVTDRLAGGQRQNIHLNLFQGTFQTMPILQAVQDLAAEHDLGLSIHIVAPFDLERERRVIERAVEDNCRMLVSSPSLTTADEDNGQVYRDLVAKGTPLALIDRKVDGTGADLVYFDYRAAGYRIVKDLADAGLREVFAPVSFSYRVDRAWSEGCLEGLRKYYPELPAKNIFDCSPSLGREPVEQAARIAAYMEANRIGPEALLCINAIVAWELFRALREKGARRSLKRIASMADFQVGDEEFNAVNWGYYRIFEDLAKGLDKALRQRLIAPRRKETPPLEIPISYRRLSAAEAERYYYQTISVPL